MSTSESEQSQAHRRWVTIGLVVAAGLLAMQVGAGGVRRAVTDVPTVLELVQTCLIERQTPFEPIADDPIALSAERGALRTVVAGTPVTLALAGSDADAERLFRAYAGVVSAAERESLLDRRRRVVFLWSAAPTEAQRQFSHLCTLDAQR